MDKATSGIGSEEPRSGAPRRGAGWLGSLALGAFLVFVYLVNGRDMGTDDTFSATLLPLNILRGEGIYFEQTFRQGSKANFALPYFWTKSRGHIVSLYPIAPALVAIPLVAPQVALMDFYRPGWDRDRALGVDVGRVMVKRSMAIIVAFAGVILHRLLLALGLRRVALPAVLTAFLGSDLWTVGSQAAWQHGPAAAALVAAIALLHPQKAARCRLALAGLATAILFTCRLMDVVFAVAIVGWLVATNPRGLVWFLPAPILGGLALVGFNLWFFDMILGGQVRLEQYHGLLHGVSGTWSTNLLDGVSGTLFSPNRGLLVFSPWIAVAIASLAVPAVIRRLAAHSLLGVLLAALVPYLFLLSKYSVWWGGHCFGPRYWTDVIPLFAILFAFALDEVLMRSRVLITIAALAVVLSIAIQMIGAFCYPSTWNAKPSNVDLHHERLWDWRDTEFSRCLLESFRRYVR